MRAVKFGRAADAGLGVNKAFPYIYNFVNREDDEWEANKGEGTAGNLTGIGPLVPSGQTVQHVIRLDPDFNFKLLWFKYTTYWHDAANSLYFWYDPVAGWFLEPTGNTQAHIGTPLTRYIRISVSFRPDSRYLYGGQNLDILTNGQGGLVPINIQSVQGYDFGYGQVRAPYWLPNWGYIVFEITNTHTIKDIVVGGIAFGMKVRV
jgi:hypothetical protein